MSHTPIEFAQRFAIDRVIRVLRTHLATELARCADRFGFELDAPEAHHIFRIANARAEEILTNADVWCSVLPVSPLAPVDGTRRTAGPDTYCQRQTLDIELFLMFTEPVQDLPGCILRPDGVTNTTALEALDTQAEFVALCSDVYAGALAYTALKYAQDGESIHEIAFEGYEPEVRGTPAGGLRGMARVLLRLTINTAAPTKAPI
jgi:hypothetical protein